MLEELVHRNGLVTLEEYSRIKVLASQQMKAFQINKLYRHREQSLVLLELVTIFCHLPEGRSGYKCRC